jgi:flagellar M-ring protein FliF
MAVAEIELNPPPLTFGQTALGRNFMLGLSIAAVLAIMAGIWMWSQQPEYRVLFANFSDRDGGAITGALDQMNVKYKFAEGGGAILVAAEQVHDIRLKLASQGLPKGGNVGFELMENQKLGVSQFLEQVNFQRALEGELARSIQSLASVGSARVHLALPKPSVFVREQQKPTASVLLNLHPGRSLDQQQVSAIVHLVASSVPDLPPANVTIVDQAGTLLSDTSKSAGAKNLDPNQLKYIMLLQQSIVKQVESIIAPIVGPGNVRAEATADVDFSQVEQAVESFKPNSPPEASAMRSQQTSESGSPAGAAAGVPGALSNQPPGAATAPLTASAPTGAAAAVAGPVRKDSTTNYEVDKTVRYEQKPMGGVKRLSVAVLVNYRRSVDKAGRVTVKALTDAEKAQIYDLVKEAMGFNKERGDTLNVTNSPFDGVDRPVEALPAIAWWRDPANVALIKEIGKYAVAALVLAFLFFRVLRPMMRPVFRQIDQISQVAAPAPQAAIEEGSAGAIAHSALEEPVSSQDQGYRENLQLAKGLAKDDPRVVAQVVKSWVGTND